MIEWELIQKILKIKTGLSYWNSKGELICRCPLCERHSLKNHGHCYVYKNKEDEIPTFHCFRCSQSSGHGSIVKLLTLIGENPEDYLSKDVYKLKYPKSSGSFTYSHTEIPYYKIDKPSVTNQYKLKRAYLHGRLGFEVDLDTIPGLILNIYKFVSDNDITIPDDKKQLMEYFERSFVGFVSSRGATLILRNIDAASKFRYNKIQLKNNEIFKDFYGINVGARNLNNTIVLVEGVFDMLVPLIGGELDNLKDNSFLWAANLGSSFLNIVPSVLEYSKLSASHFVILSDSEKKPEDYYNLRKLPSVLSLTVYWNSSAEDFGSKPINIIRKKLW